MMERLEQLLKQQRGVLKTADALDAGATKTQFYQFVKQVGLEKVAHGIYVSPDTLTDEMYLLQTQFPKVIYSHEAALYLHDLAEREPMPLTVTVENSYNSSGLTAKGVRVYYTKREWYELGVVEMESISGQNIRVYDAERTICDILRQCDKMDTAVFNYAVREYFGGRKKNLVKLSRYAAAMRVERKLREKVGVLL